VAPEFRRELKKALGGGSMTEVTTEFEPKIMGFLCNWCSYAGADLAGVSRIQYSTNIRVIRVMCSGRVDPLFVLEAFRNGADGVLIAGCHMSSDCYYLSWNFTAQRRVFLLKQVLEQLGIEPERLRLEWVSASEGDRFAKIIKDMVEKLKQLGPSPLKMTCRTGEN
jgi:F420-non-reducing hydrogenase iron-sulfur subunit